MMESGTPKYQLVKVNHVSSFRISLRWPIHIINPVDETKLSCYTSHRRSTTVSLETYPSINFYPCYIFDLTTRFNLSEALSKRIPHSRFPSDHSKLVLNRIRAANMLFFFCLAYCLKIRDPPNGRKFGTSFSHGRVVSFECKLGFELVGDRALRCIHGRWNSSVPLCKGEKALLRHCEIEMLIHRALTNSFQDSRIELNGCVSVLTPFRSQGLMLFQ